MTYDSFLSSIKRFLHQLHQLSTWSKNLTLNHQTKNKRISLDSPSLWPLVELPVVGSAVHIPNFVAMDLTLEKVLAELNVGFEIFIKPTFLWKHVCWSHIIDICIIVLHLHDRCWSVLMSSWGGFDLRRFRLSTGKVPFSRILGLQRLLCHEQSSQDPFLYQQKRCLFSKLFNGWFQVAFRVSIRFSPPHLSFNWVFLGLGVWHPALEPSLKESNKSGTNYMKILSQIIVAPSHIVIVYL